MSLWQRREGIQLAYPFDKRRLIGGGRVRLWNTPWIVQPKLNGERCRVECSGENVTLWSSECNEIPLLPHITEFFQRANFPSIELDGELYCHGMPRQEIRSRVSRTRELHPDHTSIQFHCFDVIEETQDQFSRICRLYDLKDVLDAEGLLDERLQFIESTPCTKMEEIEALLMHYYANRYEGIIVREPHALYQRKRVNTMMKWKPRKTDSYPIVGYKEEIDKDGNPKGALGAIICETDGQRFAIGSGTFLTRSVREELFRDPDSFINKFATCRYPELTQRGVPDHPVLIDITDERMDYDDD